MLANLLIPSLPTNLAPDDFLPFYSLIVEIVTLL
uniref:Uncharacterized protein n=1 Tax=Picea sitchensis TaxID=3332 RepID=A9NRR5_PICSI|nr:unknown [Picea sitchensis]